MRSLNLCDFENETRRAEGTELLALGSQPLTTHWAMSAPTSAQVHSQYALTSLSPYIWLRQSRPFTSPHPIHNSTKTSTYKGIVKKQLVDGPLLMEGRFCPKGGQRTSIGRTWGEIRTAIGRQRGCN